MNKASYDERYRRFIENMAQLPSLPAVVSHLIKVVSSPETSAEDAAEIIEKDPALTTRVLRLANSAFYGIPRSVSSVQSAVVILGFNSIKSLVLSASVMQMFPHNDTKNILDRVRFWKHSIICAVVAKTIAQSVMNTVFLDPQSAFCAGIMHDIGKLIFELFSPREYAIICGVSREKNAPLFLVESAAMGMNHADVGRILSDKWGLPLDLEQTMVYHHDPKSAQKITELVAVVHLADIITHRFDCGLWDKEALPREWDQARDILSIDDARYERIVGSLKDEIDKSKDFFAIISG
jgi:Predicted signal transduction protein